MKRLWKRLRAWFTFFPDTDYAEDDPSWRRD